MQLHGGSRPPPPPVLAAPAHGECSIPGSALHPAVTDQPQPPERSRTSNHSTGGASPLACSPHAAPSPHAAAQLTCPSHLCIFSLYL